MRLEEWMEREKLSVNDLAKKLKIFPTSITQLLSGKSFLHPRNEIAIVELTKGKVGFEDLRPYLKSGKRGKVA